MPPIVPDSTWVHYRNMQEYMVAGIATNPNTLEKVIVYWDSDLYLAEGEYYFRPIEEFLEKFTLK